MLGQVALAAAPPHGAGPRPAVGRLCLAAPAPDGCQPRRREWDPGTSRPGRPVRPCLRRASGFGMGAHPARRRLGEAEQAPEGGSTADRDGTWSGPMLAALTSLPPPASIHWTFGHHSGMGEYSGCGLGEPARPPTDEL